MVFIYLFVGKLFCSFPSQFNSCHMDVVYVYMSPSTRIPVAKSRIPTLKSLISGRGTSHSPENWCCVSTTVPGRIRPGAELNTTFPSILRASWRLNFCPVFPNFPDSWIPNTHQFSEKQNGAACWADTALRDLVPRACFFSTNPLQVLCWFSNAGRISIVLAGKLLLQPLSLQ